MSTAVQDSFTMLGRELTHARRYPELTVIVVALPVVFLLLFVFVFGGALGAGLVPGGGDRGDYAGYVLPGILVMAIASISQSTASTVAMDAERGITDRFRTLSISRGAVLTAQAVGSVLQSLLAITVVVAVGLAVGFRPQADLLGWLGAVALLVGVATAVGWIAVACGLVARSLETASNYTMPLILLPFLGSGFVPTDSMPRWLALFAEHQPFTPIMDTLRALLLATPLEARTAALATGWCVLLSVLGWAWARRLYARPRTA
jgi:ABC-2 type transport system permease protein